MAGNIFDKALNIGIFNDKAIVSYYVDQTLRHKTIKLDALVESFMATNVVHKSPLLPSNLLRYMKTGSSEIFIMFYPPEERTIRFNTGSASIKEFPTVKLPGRIWVASYKQDNISATRGYFVNAQNRFEITEDTVLYKNIFPNVYGDCKICWGYNGQNSFKRPVLADGIDFAFFNSEFNTDLANTDYYRRNNAEGVSQFLEFLSTAEKYPENYFFDSGVTVRSINV